MKGGQFHLPLEQRGEVWPPSLRVGLGTLILEKIGRQIGAKAPIVGKCNVYSLDYNTDDHGKEQNGFILAD